MLFFKLFTRSVLYSSILYASSEAPTIGGAIELEKRYGLALFFKTSTVYFEDVIKPPDAPPIALPRVELIKSILP